MKYITPSFNKYRSFNEFEKKTVYDNSVFERRNISFSLNDFFLPNKALVIAEPGYGKTELFTQIEERVVEHGKYCIHLPLKRVITSSAQEFIEKIHQEGNVESNSKKDLIFCLDALDEVDSSKVVTYLEGIANLMKQYSESTIYVSCRVHYIKQFTNNFARFLKGFDYISIEPFSNSEIHNYLELNLEVAGKEEVIDALMKKSRASFGRDSILSTPRYLKALVDTLKSKEYSKEELLNLRRADLFEVAIYIKLESEIEKLLEEDGAQVKKNEQVITKRVLEKLALVMEIAQVTQISKDELVTFLDSTQSNLNLVFLNVIDIDTFIERVLKETGEILEIRENTEFQEYLAAKELLRLGERSQILYDLTVDSTFHHIHNNWYNVLDFVFELEPKHVLPVVNLLTQKEGYLVEDHFFRLLYNVDANKLTDKDKGSVFVKLYWHFQKSQQYICGWIEVFGKFYDPSVYNDTVAIDLKTEDENYLLLKWNQVFIISEIAKIKQLSDKQNEYWKKALVEEITQESSDTEIKYISLDALGFMGDIGLLESIKPYVYDNQEQGEKSKLADRYIRACADLAPDNEFTLNLLVDSISKEHEGAGCSLYKFKSTKSIVFLLDKFQENVSEFINYWETGFPFYCFSNFTRKINEFWNSDIKNSVLNLLSSIITLDVEGNFQGYKSRDVVGALSEVLAKQDANFIFELISWLKEHKIYAEDFVSIFADHLMPETVERFVNVLDNNNQYVGGRDIS